MSAALVLRRSLLTKSVGSRGLAGGHGHGHGPAKVLPPRPALAANASFGQRIQHQLWDKRHPDYEGAEAYVRYYLPHNHNLVYAILGLYGVIIAYNIVKGKSKDRAALAAAPKPDVPDYHTPVPASSDIPEFGTDAFVTFVNASEANVDKWVKSLPA